MISRCPLASRKKNPAIADVRALLHLFLAAEPEDLRPRPAGQSGAGGIVGIQDREILRLLILKDARLGVGVGLESAVAVEVVGRDVEHDGNFWTKCLNRLQLETRYFQHHDGVRLRLLDQGDCRSADIAADRGRKAARRDNFTRQGCGRGLPVRTGDGDDVLGQKLRRQLNLADHGLAQRRGPAPAAANLPERRG